MTKQNLKFRPGAIVRHIFDGQYYLIVSLPIIVKANQQVVCVLPITENFKTNTCQKLPHVIVPTNLAIHGIICPHQELQFDCSQIEYVDQLSDHLLAYLQNIKV